MLNEHEFTYTISIIAEDKNEADKIIQGMRDWLLDQDVDYSYRVEVVSGKAMQWLEDKIRSQVSKELSYEKR